MFSARRVGTEVHIRAHRVFLRADAALLDEMARVIVHRDPAARQAVRSFVRAHRAAIRPAARTPASRLARVTRGAHHDLGEIFEQLEARYFADAMHGVTITWGRAAPRGRRRRRSIQLGLYVPEERLIRIHRALDQSWVPRFYIASVIFHEMLHHCMPPVRRGQQLVFHTPQFRALERAFEHHRAADEWERAHIDRLLDARS